MGLGESSTAQTSVEEFRARQARTRLYYTECESSGQFLSSGIGSGLRGGEHLLKRARPCGGERPPLGEGAPLWERACSF